MTENEIGDAIITSAIKVHSALGPGLLENAYEVCLTYELTRAGLSIRKQVPISIRYEELILENGYRIDLLANDRMVIELKALETVLPVHRGQLLSYLRLGDSSSDTCSISMCHACAKGSRGWSMDSDPLRPPRNLRVLCAKAFSFSSHPHA
jgi:GxxExxY protein